MRPEVIARIDELRGRLSGVRKNGGAIGFVPTMGALHAGHGALMDAARRDCDCVVVSIFVNPIQFDKKVDYEQYGRNLEADLAFAGSRGVDVVFAPNAQEMYPAGENTFVEVPDVSESLCGTFRPGHFRGVATVVTKLFNIVQPGTAYFGEKDAQQLAVIRRMAAGLNMPISIVGVATVRASDGLALSSRNERLTREERIAAPLLFQALEAAQRVVESGAGDVAELRAAGLNVLAKEPRIRVEYFEIVDAESMQPVTTAAGRICIAAAVWLGSVRLIDNVFAYARMRTPISGTNTTPRHGPLKP
jgi:pantoate--beta-alanine ligase